MKLRTIPYPQYEKTLPQKGNHILAQQSEDTIIVYQAFNPRIASYAVEHQKFGGDHYRYSRMSWIKPNFLWMMYRCGWATKEAQKQVLAIEITKDHFLEILKEGVHSSFKNRLYENEIAWKDDVQNSNVRIQWDPDHYPSGEKHIRKAIQLGLRNSMLEKFGKHEIVSIQNITNFVLEQGQRLKKGQLDRLEVMQESIFEIKDQALQKRLLLSSL